MQPINWRPYDGDTDSTVVGDVRISDPVGVDYLDLERELLAYLPPSYEESDAAFPVVYMHDGQNLFDEATSHDGEWRVDETMDRLAAEGLEAIVIGIPNAGDLRPVEYSPFVDRDAFDMPDDQPNPHAGRDPLGDDYVGFLVDRVVPMVEDRFRTSGERGLFGSSMGGLISAYGFFREPGTFDFAGAMSPAVTEPWAELFAFVESVGYVDGRIYVDVGGDEFPETPERSAGFERAAERLVETLEEVGYDDELRYVYDPDAIHHEDEWANRFPDAIRFLLGGHVETRDG